MVPRTASAKRQERAEQVTLLDVRRISDEVWEVDLVNDRGESRENVTIIPNRIYSPSKDMQHRGKNGHVGKYIRALALENEDAREQLENAIEERRNRIQEEISSLKEKDSNLLHAQVDLDRNA